MVATVVDNGMSVRAEADFEEGNRLGLSFPLELCPDDVLTINGEAPRMTQKVGRIVYSVTLEDPEGPRGWTFSLDRGSENESFEAEVMLPFAFDIGSPSPGQSIPRSSDLEVVWGPDAPGEQIRLELLEEIGYGVCLRTENTDHAYKDGGQWIPDLGSWVIPAGTIAGESSEMCEAQLELGRSSEGDYPAALGDGGYIEGRVVRSVGFVSVP